MGAEVDALKARIAAERVVVTPETQHQHSMKLVEEYIKAAVKDIVVQALQEASALVHRDTGKYSESLTKANVVVTRITPTQYHVLIARIAPYGEYVEEGRQPGKGPPPKKLEAWVERHLGLKGAEAKSVAYLIGRKIAAKGLVGDGQVQAAITRVAATIKL